MTVLKTAIATYPHTKALKDGAVTAPGIRFEHLDIAPIRLAIHRMCRELEFDLCEMAFTTYLAAREYGKPFTALPVFVMRQFPQGLMVRNVKSGVRSPKDLEGKRVGIRAWTVTTGVWARGILKIDYGVDLDKIHWVAVEEEHVQEYTSPPNVLYQTGRDLAEMVASGDIAAAIGVGHVDSPDVKPLFANSAEVEAAWYRKTGVYPLNHAIVVKNAHLQADPELAPRLFSAFKEAKEAFLAQLHSGAKLSGDALALANRRPLVGNDPLPFGAGPNRKSLEMLIQFAQDQKILRRKVNVAELFASGTLDLQ
jgi:4,5-dihydroxyphthalate decarboxylase